uniref:AlNc14C421G11530 protein n=1 Tax=Albugo laibachii Nc14 TaxID=890382 RepID=F0WZC7_9STRA|nr:AlNc14C421G11530 [Albugo laibachii Nc14]|eukprot:CCA26845.1 AlNc14C421G11530 [Albugo laibachii Nc14]
MRGLTVEIVVWKRAEALRRFSKIIRLRSSSRPMKCISSSTGCNEAHVRCFRQGSRFWTGTKVLY